MQTPLFLGAVLVSIALSAPAAMAFRVPTVECLFPPSYQGEQICVLHWIVLPDPL